VESSNYYTTADKVLERGIKTGPCNKQHTNYRQLQTLSKNNAAPAQKEHNDKITAEIQGLNSVWLRTSVTFAFKFNERICMTCFLIYLTSHLTSKYTIRMH